MKRLIAAALAFAALPLFARGNLTVNIKDRDDRITRCGQISVYLDSQPFPMIEEDVTSVRGLRSLSVTPAKNGGVYVIGTNESAFSVTACKAAWDGNASRITTDLRGRELTANIPDDVEGVIYFLVRAPRNAELDVQSHNGPLSVRDFEGTLNARTHNGPVSFSGRSGVVTIEAHNGPISINLDGTSFDGSLDVHAHNGPLSLNIPSGYRSGVVVDADGRGPFTCHAAECRNAKRSWDDDAPRRIELGSGTTVVRLSVGNGPLSIRDSD